MNRSLVLAAVVALVVAAAVYGRTKAVQAREWEFRAEEALRDARDLQDVVKEARRQAAANAAAADEWKERADSASARVPPSRIVEIREIPVPVECEGVVAIRDTVIDTLFVANQALDSAYTAKAREVDFLQQGLAAQTQAADSLRVALATRPSSPAWYIPSVRPGAFVGACLDGTLCGGFGVTLSWNVH